MAFGCVIEVDNAIDAELASSAEVVVTERMGDTTRFELRMSAAVADGDIPEFLDSRFDPGTPVSIFADDGQAGVVCLLSGEADGQRLSVVHGGEGSSITVTGGDITLTMDREVKSTVWEGPLMTDSMIVSTVLASYGCVPVVAPTVASRPPSAHPMVQRRTDLGFMRQLARRNGCLFWIRPEAAAVGPVIHTASFAPPEFADGDLAELTLNQRGSDLTRDPNTITALAIDFDVTPPVSVTADGVDLVNVQSFNADADLSAAETLGTTPASAIGPTPRQHRLTAASDTAADLTPRGEGVLAEAQFFIRARCSTTLRRLRRVVRAHDTVRVVGAGSRHSGRYYVAAVTHRFGDEDHWMDIDLVRNAWGEEPGGLGGLV
ncbi:MAG: hypothetical protein DHS20C19_22430 [Acidimicrobiales bacterium]|nr:MAG: hypothetical protein DHS20C19_22430 [Acidimicrobiales bacterium]